MNSINSFGLSSPFVFQAQALSRPCLSVQFNSPSICSLLCLVAELTADIYYPFNENQNARTEDVNSAGAHYGNLAGKASYMAVPDRRSRTLFFDAVTGYFTTNGYAGQCVT